MRLLEYTDRAAQWVLDGHAPVKLNLHELLLVEVMSDHKVLHLNKCNIFKTQLSF